MSRTPILARFGLNDKRSRGKTGYGPVSRSPMLRNQSRDRHSRASVARAPYGRSRCGRKPVKFALPKPVTYSVPIEGPMFGGCSHAKSCQICGRRSFFVEQITDEKVYFLRRSYESACTVTFPDSIRHSGIVQRRQHRFPHSPDLWSWTFGDRSWRCIAMH